MQTIHVHLVITTDKPVKDLSELVAGRAWTIDGVNHVEVDEVKSGSWSEEPTLLPFPGLVKAMADIPERFLKTL